MFRFVRRMIARLLNRLSGPPPDPYAPVRVPRGRTPGGRSSAVAVEEPETSNLVRAVGTSRSRHPEP
jgi:hypothetical protein